MWKHKSEYTRGVESASAFLTKLPSQAKIVEAYYQSEGAPDQTDFDKGWRDVLKEQLPAEDWV